jgi:cholestenol Delta-isomerase
MSRANVPRVPSARPELPPHPYFPVGVNIPDYVANEMTTVEIMSMFAVGCVAILLIAYSASRKIRPNLANIDLATTLWFVLSGSIHLGMEGT